MKSVQRSFVLILLVVGMMVSLIPLAAAQDVPFTIQADMELQASLGMLLEASIGSADGVFVDADADLSATAIGDAPEMDGLPAVFMPGAALVVLTDNAEASAFVDFAVSPDGQQVLIDAGILPDVVTVTDQDGNTVEIPQPVRKVMSAHGPSVYFLYGVGAGDRIVSANYLGARKPPVTDTMTRIDPNFPEKTNSNMTTNEIDIEEVAQIDPDVVFTSPRSPWIDTVKELGIPIILYYGETPELIKEATSLTGQIFGPDATARAEAWNAYYDSVFEAVAASVASLDEGDKVKVLFTGTEPLRIASGDMYQSSLIEAAGGISVSGELTGYWNDVNLEQIVLWNPDVILVPSYGGASVEAITESEEWQALDAVQAGRVYQLPQLVAPWDTPVPDSVLTIIWLAEKLYPNLIKLDCAAEVDTFYNTFYDYAISEEEVAGLCAK